MYPLCNKPKKDIDTVNKPLTADEQADKQTDKIKELGYPFSLLLLESEDDSFVKGYN